MLKKETNNQYHGESEHLSSSFIRRCDISTLHASQPVEKTEAMIVGSVYHSLIEGIKDYFIFDVSNRPEPNKGMNSTLNKEWKAQLFEENENVISVENFNEVQAMYEALNENEFAAKVRNTANENFAEISIYTEINGIKVKVRPDKIIETKDEILCVDWKSIRELTERTCRNSILFDGLIYQCIHYQLGIEYEFLKPCRFAFVFQEKKAPYDILPVIISTETIEQYKPRYFELLEKANKFKQSGIAEGIASNYDKKYYLL